MKYMLASSGLRVAVAHKRGVRGDVAVSDSGVDAEGEEAL